VTLLTKGLLCTLTHPHCVFNSLGVFACLLQAPGDTVEAHGRDFIKADNLSQVTTPRLSLIPEPWEPKVFKLVVYLGCKKGGRPRSAGFPSSSSDASAAAASSSETEYAKLYHPGEWQFPHDCWFSSC
jgi:hypothetical protein